MPSPTVSPVKRALGWLLFLAAIAVGPTVVLLTAPSPKAQVPPPSAGCSLALGLVAGGLFLFTSAIAYLATFLATGFVFDFYGRPVWPRLKRNLWFANIAFMSLLIVGIGTLVASLLAPLLTGFGLSAPTAFMVPAIGSFAVLQLLASAINVWVPVERRALKRSMHSRGVSDVWPRSAFFGISDANRSAFGKFWRVHVDVGILSVEPDQLVFRGEKGTTSIPRTSAQLSREADAGNTAALFGISHVVLRYADAQAGPTATRLHPLGEFAIWQYKRRLDLIEKQLTEWLRHGP